MSDNIHNLPGSEELRKQFEALKRNGGGGTFDGMEERVRQLETDMAFIKGKLDDMPTKDWMTTRLAWVVGVFLALSAIIQLLIEAIGPTPPSP